MTDIGIIIPAYNVEDYIERSIKSVMRQKSNNWRLLVVDDGSTDNTFEIATAISRNDDRVAVISQTNKGSSAAIKRAAQILDTKWVTYICADDEVSESYCMNMGILQREYPGYVMYGCNYLNKWSSGDTPALSHSEVTEVGDNDNDPLLLTPNFRVDAMYRFCRH